MRINKFLAAAGFGSRRKCEELVACGKVLVNGKLCVNLATEIDVKKDKVVADGKPAVILAFEYLMLHKPKGYVTTKSDDKGRKTVMNLLPEELKHLNPVGRLDYDTEGLLLFTNDGDFANALMHPRGEMPKTYHVKIEGSIQESELAVLRAGVVIDGERTEKSKVKVLTKTGATTTIEMVIFEGRNRQIRKMVEAIGRRVAFLKRVGIGNLKLGGLTRGKYRFLKELELAELMQCGSVEF